MITALLLAACMALALGACGSKNTQEPAAQPEAQETASASETASGGSGMLGGWTISEDGASAVPADAKEVFDKAIQGYTGMKLEPKALLATQVVSGENLAFLCLGERVVQNPVKGWYVVVVYKNLQGEARISSVEEIDLTAYIKN